MPPPLTVVAPLPLSTSFVVGLVAVVVEIADVIFLVAASCYDVRALSFAVVAFQTTFRARVVVDKSCFVVQCQAPSWPTT